jgi:MOSC domain-containing protein YiiM
MTITSHSLGNPERHLPFDHLCRALHDLPAAPRDNGRLALIVRRLEQGRRETPERLLLTPEGGVTGDAWGRNLDRDPVAQIAVMQADVARLIGNGQPLALFGDSLFLELDLSRENLTTGSRLQVGGATLEVTPKPHNGCTKFRARFGSEALRLVSDASLRHRNLRGIYLQVVEAGEIVVGDDVKVVTRFAAGSVDSNG